MPPGVVLDVVMLNVELPVFVTVAGLKLAAQFVGRPPTLKFTLPEKLLLSVIATLNVVPTPAVTDCVAGAAASEKSCTFKIGPAVSTMLPLVAVTVSG
jgi:hypothetical protein